MSNIYTSIYGYMHTCIEKKRDTNPKPAILYKSNDNSAIIDITVCI